MSIGYKIFFDEFIGEMRALAKNSMKNSENTPFRTRRRGVFLCKYHSSESPIHSSSKMGASLTRSVIS